MFVDIVKISIKAGDGGDGAVSFRREKYVSRGGPDGGDGGKGGAIVFVANEGMHTLLDFRYHAKFKAENGENGKGGNCTGKSGQDLIIEVPRGTVIKNAETGKVLADLSQKDSRVVLLQGGHFGKGNIHFATSTRQAPNFAHPGEKTQQHEVILELKSIADVGLIGFPNVGKSTLLSVVSAARPKIGDFPFTTITPNFGMVKAGEYSFLMADIPGLIEGAHTGTGLGDQFLRHIERTRLLVHIIDISGCEGRDPLQDYDIIRNELFNYSEKLAKLPQIVAANKMDLPNAQENFACLQEKLKAQNVIVFPISCATNSGIQVLMFEIAKRLQELPAMAVFEAEDVIVSEKTFVELTISRQGGVYEIMGSIVENLIQSVNFDDYDSMQYFQRMLREKGVVKALREFGVKDGDTVRIGDAEFDFIE